MGQNVDKLTPKEKQTLRLLLRGYDAKSIARESDLSVHTINERLRNARRKLAVSSSREAARVLAAEEQQSGVHQTPQKLAYKNIGDDGKADDTPNSVAPKFEAQARQWGVPLLVGVIILTITLAAIALMSPTAETAGQQQLTSSEAAAPTEAARPLSALDPEMVGAAEDWLALADAGEWNESWDRAGGAFRKLNSVDAWIAASTQANSVLGNIKSRTAIAVEDVPAPPSGYMMVVFRSSFTKLPEATERVTLEREGDEWRVVGYWIT